MFSVFHSPVFMVFVRVFTHVLWRSLNIVIIFIFKSSSYASATLFFPEMTAAGLLASWIGILSWLHMFVFSFTGIQVSGIVICIINVYIIYQSVWYYLVLSLMSGCSLVPLMLGNCGDSRVPGTECSCESRVRDGYKEKLRLTVEKS